MGFVQLRSALEIFFFLCNYVPANKAASVCQFFAPKKCYNPLSLSILSRFISARLFSVPQVENEVKRTPLFGCYWDPRSCNWWIKEGSKRGIFSRFFRNCTTAQSLYICQWILFWIKEKVCVVLMCSQFLKKWVLKLLDCTVYIYRNTKSKILNTKLCLISRNMSPRTGAD